jgi:sulfur carrier protein
MTQETQSVTINGESHDIPVGATLEDALRMIDIDPLYAKGIAIAVNDEVVRKPEWKDVQLAAGDRLEVITARQGG